jgi:CubicO group peptidase (beta-lactamase class C family)
VLPSLDVPVAQCLPGRAGDLPDGLLLVHLLAMTRGTGVGGAADMDVVMTEPGPWLPAILAAPALDAPGTTFRYDNAAAHLAAIALDAALGGGLDRFARERLFAPLDITAYEWKTDSLGVPRGDWGVVVSTRDLAELGALYLARGSRRGQRIVSERYVARATTAVTAGGAPEDEAYGLMWWVEPGATPPGFFAGGYAGQLLSVIPALGLVTVLTGEEEALRPGWRSARSVVRDFVVPALAGGGGQAVGVRGRCGSGPRR